MTIDFATLCPMTAKWAQESAIQARSAALDENICNTPDWFRAHVRGIITDQTALLESLSEWYAAYGRASVMTRDLLDDAFLGLPAYPTPDEWENVYDDDEIEF